MIDISDIPAEELKKEKSSDKKIRTDALLRETSTNYIRLIGDADRKARIMLLVNSVFLTISVTVLAKSIHDIPYVWISATLLMISNVVTLLFSIQSVKPEFRHYPGKESENNIFHYKKCRELSLEKYGEELRDIMNDNTKKLDAIIKEIYHYGNLLTLKYKLLKTAYRVFSWGIVLSVFSYLIIILFINK